MNGLIVFNSANDVIYQKFNAELNEHICRIAISQGLLPKESEPMLANPVDSNITLQIFSPLINSQRIMHCQFENTYSSIQCDNDLNFVFGDLLGYQFLKIAQQPVEILERTLGVIIGLAKHLYGAHLFAANASEVQKQMFTLCLDYYERNICHMDQSLLVEALPRLLIGSDLRRLVENGLTTGLEGLMEMGYLRCHILMFANDKFVAMKSAKSCIPLNPTDLLFLSLLSKAVQYSFSITVNGNCSLAVFLEGVAANANSGCIPCIVHLAQMNKGVHLIQIIEYSNLSVASRMYDTFFVLQKFITAQLQNDTEAMKSVFENLDFYVRQSLDALKKAKLKGDDVETALKKFTAKWENLRKMYNEYLKTCEGDLILRLESNIQPFAQDLKQLFAIVCCDSSAINFDQLPQVTALIDTKLVEFSEFLLMKAERNVAIDAYLEDFPGLLHFIYINRSSGLFIAPDIKPLNQKLVLSPTNLLNMMEMTRTYLKQGQTTVMWKDKTYNYGYFLWFEDRTNGSVKTIDLQQQLFNSTSTNMAFKPPFEPGLLAGDYYHLLIEQCFPKTPATKIKCYELFCIHLGLVTTTCAVEHARRLVATIADITGDDRF